MMTVSQAFQTALVHHRAGRLPQAEQILRQISLEEPQNAPAMHLLGVVCLQSGQHDAAVQFEVRELGPDWDQSAGPFLDSAAVMMNLDLVVTADTVTAHLAGALGVPVWVALAKRADWRWQLDRQDTPWYPTMRLFRQSKFHEWSDVFEVIATQLRTLAGRPDSRGRAARA